MSTLQEDRLKQTYLELERLAHDKNEFASFVSAVAEVYRRIDEAVSVAATTARLEIVCRSGCCVCCPRGVEVELFEILPLLADLNERPTAAIAAALETAQKDGKAGSGRMSFAGMFLDEAKKDPPHCFLLNENATCSVYAYRPLACRLHVSSSMEVCREKSRPQFSPGFAADLDSRVNKIVGDFAAAGHSLLTGLGGPMYQMLTYEPRQRQFALDVFGHKIIFAR